MPDDVPAAIGKHDFHMDERDRKEVHVHEAGTEDFVEVCRSDDFGAVFATSEKALDDAAEKPRTIWDSG